MGRYLFEMSEAELDRAVERHYDQMYNDYYHLNDPEPCCGNCKYHCGSDCCICEYVDEAEDYKTVDDDDYCEQWKVDDSYPDYLDGDY